jgi:hypothetical protein
MRLVPRSLAVLALAAGCATTGRAPPAAFEPDQAPPAAAPAVARADAAMGELRQRLQRRLGEVMADPSQAVSVCRDEAPAIAAAVAASSGVKVGRTSHRLRSGANAPPAWAAPFVAAAAGKKAAEVKAVAVDLGDRVGLLRPIPTGQGCLRCHGPAEGLAPPVRASIARAYPADQATGFAEGDLRGFFWAEASR